ncbi:hypothetical protein AVDCRST_MAG94-1780 [uncultured Leptolyngbya sp.]|uniref:Uncharacterized protein n=1 Tax=uncultured Leptolyngbya sp. TaxID=332963 RepID=A0A6J4LCG4_9CYAN|nr:hypothetical protein AVDCRST_MAG94-1780 [uncultured Leptolyngbya sp.]
MLLGKANVEDASIPVDADLDRLSIDPTSLFTHWVVVRAIALSLGREARSLAS